MKRYIFIVAMVAAVFLMTSCRNDWTIKDMPPVPEKADGAGYVTGFDESEAAVIIPVEVPAAGNYRIAVCGRASQDGTPGTGAISCGSSSAQLSFGQAYSWAESEVTLSLEAGVNNLVISGENGNGLFHIDYIEVR